MLNVVYERTEAQMVSCDGERTVSPVRQEGGGVTISPDKGVCASGGSRCPRGSALFLSCGHAVLWIETQWWRWAVTLLGEELASDQQPVWEGLPVSGMTVHLRLVVLLLP